MTRKLGLILGDQLSERIATLAQCNRETDIILIAEVLGEAQYVRHHVKKIVFLFSAMRHFAQHLRAIGWTVDYIALDAPGNTGTLSGEVARAARRHGCSQIIATHPGEYRVLKDMEGWNNVTILPDDRFYCTMEEFAGWAANRKTLRMENFYEIMRVRHNVLMEGDHPMGGRWNFDDQNRVPVPENYRRSEPLAITPDETTREVMALVAARFAGHFGDIEPFSFAVTREDALKALTHFITHRLPDFGAYQDAMVQGDPWVYHSILSPYINCGLLSPREVVDATQDAWHAGTAPLNSVEGFIRQILGWREYIRGVYWLKMPGYELENRLEAKRPLPWLYWSGDTKMNCMRQCVNETRRHAYAHHIQRLMVLGNFALIAGIDPQQVQEWFLVVYADAYEWVELPNVSGMILFADGGYLASKPYAASGAYINKMSDYCKSCSYDVNKKNGPKACPFNYLYWDFMLRNRERLRDNHRLSYPYATLRRMTPEKIAAIEHDARIFLDALPVTAGDDHA